MENFDWFCHFQFLSKGISSTMLRIVAASCQELSRPYRSGGKGFFSRRHGRCIGFHEKGQGKLCFLVKSQGSFHQKVCINPASESRSAFSNVNPKANLQAHKISIVLLTCFVSKVSILQNQPQHSSKQENC